MKNKGGHQRLEGKCLAMEELILGSGSFPMETMRSTSKPGGQVGVVLDEMAHKSLHDLELYPRFSSTPFVSQSTEDAGEMDGSQKV